MVRTRASSFLVCAAMMFALAACGSDTVSGDGSDSRGHANLIAAASPPAQRVVADATPVQPVTDALHFDLDCDLHGRVISDAHPEMFRGTYPANIRTWHYRMRDIYDLQAMHTCNFNLCAQYGPRPIVRVTTDQITLLDEPGASMSIRRSDWRYEQRMEEMGQVSVTTGSCTKAPFSGFFARRAGRSRQVRG
jgi:hypothetical protein